MTIEIRPETERVVREELSDGHFASVDELILRGVEAWRERNLGHPAADRSVDAGARARKFVEWAKSHPATPPLSDEAISRASLNPDRW